MIPLRPPSGGTAPGQPGLPRRPLRVLHVAQPTDAGVAAYVRALCADQRARAWRVAVASPHAGRLRLDLAESGVPWLRWEADRSPGPATVPELARLRRLLTAVRPDVLHLHSSKAGLAGRLAARGSLPTLFQPHGWSWLAVSGRLARATLAWERIAGRWTTSYVCVGPGEAEQGRRHRLTGRFTVIRTGVDLGRFAAVPADARAAARHQLGLDPGAPLAVCVGRVTRQKGQDTLLAAWPAVRAACPDAQLAVVGSGDLLPALRASAPTGVRFTGTVEDARPWYAASDVVVLPSRWEGVPLTLLEALAMGRSVVASAIPGIAEVLPPGAGHLVPVDAVAPLARAVADRLARPALAGAEGQVGAAFAAAELDARCTFDSLAALTVELARRRAHPVSNSLRYSWPDTTLQLSRQTPWGQ